jgi:putative peptidoglycan lipid II flippase
MAKGGTHGVRAFETARLARATLGMAAGTLLSRATGFARLFALGYALGVKNPLADSYNLANTTPNIIFDLLIGGVLSGTVVPVFVERLAARTDKEAWDDISAVLTGAGVILVAATALVVVFAPQIIDLFMSGHQVGDLARERAAASFLLRLFAPQVAFYGLIGLVTAVLNARRRFAAPMFVPIANNLVVIGVLLAVHALYPAPNLVSAAHHPALLILLGVGTTGGVVVQGLLLIPSLLRAAPLVPHERSQARVAAASWWANTHDRGDSWDRLARMGRLAATQSRRALHWRWAPRNPAVRRILRLSGWTFGFVLTNQVAYFIVLHLAFLSGEGGITSYTYAYTFFQLPVGIMAVSIMSAIQPELAEHWTRRDREGFRRRASAGLRSVVVAVIPPTVGYIVLAVPISSLVLAHGAGTLAGARATASVLEAFSLGLPGFCAFLFLSSAFQATQDTRTVFFLYLVENGINVLAAFLLEPFLGAQGLGLALSIAYTGAALLAGPVLARRLDEVSDTRVVPSGVERRKPWWAPRDHDRLPTFGGLDRLPTAPSSTETLSSAAATVSDTGQLYLALPGPGGDGPWGLGAGREGPARSSRLSPGLGRAVLRVCVLSIIMGAVVVVVASHVGSDRGVGDLVRVLASVGAGVAVLGLGAAAVSVLTNAWRRGDDRAGRHEDPDSH